MDNNAGYSGMNSRGRASVARVARRMVRSLRARALGSVSGLLSCALRDTRHELFTSLLRSFRFAVRFCRITSFSLQINMDVSNSLGHHSLSIFLSPFAHARFRFRFLSLITTHLCWVAHSRAHGSPRIALSRTRIVARFVLCARLRTRINSVARARARFAHWLRGFHRISLRMLRARLRFRFARTRFGALNAHRSLARIISRWFSNSLMSFEDDNQADNGQQTTKHQPSKTWTGLTTKRSLVQTLWTR